MSELLKEQLLTPNQHTLFVTGAGISIASGIAPFRGTPDAVWSTEVMEKGTWAHFRRDPVGAWAWFLRLFGSCRGALPNPAHMALRDLETWILGRGDKCTTITQNVDCLHVDAGMQNLIEVHGDMRHLRCIDPKCPNGGVRGMVTWDDLKTAAFLENPSPDTLPRCDRCRSMLRPHVLWFDEMYDGHDAYGIQRAIKALDEMTSVVFIGTSFAVTITDLIMRSAYEQAIPMYLIDPYGKGSREIHLIAEKAEEFLPRFMNDLTKTP